MSENLEGLQAEYDKLQELEDELIDQVCVVVIYFIFLISKNHNIPKQVGDDKQFDNIEFVKLTIRDTRDGFPTTKPAVSGIQVS